MVAFEVAMRMQCVLLAVTCFLCEAHFFGYDTYNPRYFNPKVFKHRFVRNVSSEPQNVRDTENVSNENSAREDGSMVFQGFNGHSNDDLRLRISSIELNTEQPVIKIVVEDDKLSNSSNTQSSNSTQDIDTTTGEFIDPSEPIDYFHVNVTNDSESENSSVSTLFPNGEANNFPYEEILPVLDMNDPNTIFQDFILETENSLISTPAPNSIATHAGMTTTSESGLIDKSNVTIQKYSSTSEKSLISTIYQNPNTTAPPSELTDDSNLTSVSINFKNKNASVSTTAPNIEATDIEMTTWSDVDFIDHSNETIKNYDSTIEKSSIDENHNSIDLRVEPTDNSNVTSQNTSSENQSSLGATPPPPPNDEFTTVQIIFPSETVPNVSSNQTTKNANFTSEISPIGPVENFDVTTQSIILENQTPMGTNPAPNAKFTMVKITSADEPVSIDNLNEAIKNCTSTMIISSIDVNFNSTTVKVETEDNSNVTTQSITLENQNLSETTTSTPDSEFTEPIPINSSSETILDYSTTSETSDISIITDPNSSATTVPSTSTNNLYNNSGRYSLGSKNPLVSKPKSEIVSTLVPNTSTVSVQANTSAKNSSSILPNALSKYSKVDGSSNKSNSTVDVDGKTNLTLVTENPDDPDASKGSTTIEKISTIVKGQNCTSMLRSALIDSFTTVLIKIDAQLLDKFIDALNESFIEVYDQLHPSNLMKFLDLIDKSHIIDNSVNCTLQEISVQKSLMLEIIDEEKLPPKLNDTIWRIFKEIENPLKKLNREEFRNNTLRNEISFDITNLIKSTINKLLLNIREKAIVELYETKETKNSLIRIKATVDDFLDNTQLFQQKFSPRSSLFAEMILNLIEEAVNLKDDLIENFQYSWIDLLLKVEDEKKLFNNLSASVSLILENSQKELQTLNINQLENAKMLNHFDELNQLIESDRFNFSHDVKILFNNSIRFSKILHDNLKISFEYEEESFAIYAETIGILTNAMYRLQKEVPSLLDLRFFNDTISFDNSQLNEMYESAAKKEIRLFYLCEGANNTMDVTPEDNQHETDVTEENFTPENNTRFSTSDGQFKYPFEYSLICILLIHYQLLM